MWSRWLEAFVTVAVIGVGSVAHATEHWQAGVPLPEQVPVERAEGAGREQLGDKRRPGSTASEEVTPKTSETQSGREVRVRYSEKKDVEGQRR